MVTKVFEKKYNLSFKKSRLIPHKVHSKEVQLEFIKRMNSLLDSAIKPDSKNILLYLDPVHQVYNSGNGYSWQKCGKKGTKLIRTTSHNKRLNIIGALNPISLKITSIISESNCDKHLMNSFFYEIKKEYADASQINIILDNASYNKAIIVIETAKELGINLIYLPSYSPNLNLIERVWKFFKKKVMQSQFYPTFQLFFEAVISFFSNQEDYRVELETLLTTKFEVMEAF